jgi:hypothetical protein
VRGSARGGLIVKNYASSMCVLRSPVAGPSWPTHEPKDRSRRGRGLHIHITGRPGKAPERELRYHSSWTYARTRRPTGARPVRSPCSSDPHNLGKKFIPACYRHVTAVAFARHRQGYMGQSRSVRLESVTAVILARAPQPSASTRRAELGTTVLSWGVGRARRWLMLSRRFYVRRRAWSRDAQPQPGPLNDDGRQPAR